MTMSLGGETEGAHGPDRRVLRRAPSAGSTTRAISLAAGRPGRTGGAGDRACWWRCGRWAEDPLPANRRVPWPRPQRHRTRFPPRRPGRPPPPRWPPSPGTSTPESRPAPCPSELGQAVTGDARQAVSSAARAGRTQARDRHRAGPREGCLGRPGWIYHGRRGRLAGDRPNRTGDHARTQCHRCSAVDGRSWPARRTGGTAAACRAQPPREGQR